MPCRDFEPVTTSGMDEIPRHGPAALVRRKALERRSVESHDQALRREGSMTRRDRFNEYVMTALSGPGIDLEEAAARFEQNGWRGCRKGSTVLRSVRSRIAPGRMALRRKILFRMP